VVRDSEVHKEVINNIINFVLEHKLFIKQISYSPIKGPEGNIEYLIYLSKKESPGVEKNLDLLVDTVVKQAHNELSST